MQLWFALEALDAVNPAELNDREAAIKLHPRVDRLSQRVLEFVKQLGSVHELIDEQAHELRHRWCQNGAVLADLTRREADPSLDQPMVS